MIIFRCNASPTVGFGHLVRCRSLALALVAQGASCIMMGPLDEYRTVADRETFSHWVPRQQWRSSLDDGQEFLRLAECYGANSAVLDDYRVDEEYQLLIKEAGLPWLQFDGRAHQALYGDIILNTSPGARVLAYKDLVRSDATLLFGPKYALLRPEFKEISLRAAVRPVERVLLTFGGGDDRGGTLFVLRSLIHHSLDSVHFVILSGAANPRNSEIGSWIAQHGEGRVRLVINPPQVASLIASCDVAIMAGGTTVYEVARCKLPMVLLAIAENQVRHSLAWQDIGMAEYVGMLDSFGGAELQAAYDRAVQVRQGQHDLCQAVVDGRGADRIATELRCLG